MSSRVIAMLLLLVSPLAAAPAVTVTTTEGDEHTGMLTSLTAAEVVITADGQEQKVPVEGILKIAVLNQKPALVDTKLIEVVFADGSRLLCSGATAKEETVTLTSPTLGEMKVSQKQIATLRLQPAQEELEAAWGELKERELKRDLLVVARSKGVLDHIDGIIGDIDDKFVKFLLDGDEIPVPRDRVFGLIYNNPQSKASPLCTLTFTNQEKLQVDELTFADEALLATTVTGSKVTVPVEKLQSLDYSQLKVQYLSQMEPRDVDYKLVFDEIVNRDICEYRRDKNQIGEPLSIKGRQFRHGLWLHSKTTITYRLNKEYRQLKAIAGIDDLVGKRGRGDVELIILGDGKTLHQSRVKGTDPEKEVKLDVTDVRDLEIIVDFGEGLDQQADHLVLGDIRVIK